MNKTQILMITSSPVLSLSFFFHSFSIHKTLATACIDFTCVLSYIEIPLNPIALSLSLTLIISGLSVFYSLRICVRAIQIIGFVLSAERVEQNKFISVHYLEAINLISKLQSNEALLFIFHGSNGQV